MGAYPTNTPVLWAVTGPITIYLKSSISPMPIYLYILIGPTVCHLNRYWPNSKLSNRPIGWKIVIDPVKINGVEFRVVMKRKFANGGPITVCLSGRMIFWNHSKDYNRWKDLEFNFSRLVVY